LTEAGLPIMCNFFENGHASQLEDLAVLNIKGIQSLCEVLNNEHCPNLKFLTLKDNSIADKGARALCDTLSKGLCKLNRLDIIKCELTDGCIPTLVKALQDERCQLTYLTLVDNAIGDKGACMLFEDALTKEHCKLTDLQLDRCSLTDRCVPSLCKALQDERCQLTYLSLVGNDIGDKVACMLFEDALTKERCKLTGLRLAICSLTDECITSLCKALQDGQCVLTRLVLQGNNFSGNGKKLLRNTMNYESCKARDLQIVIS
jgi:Ran GTPase-activating protein (RanGAP) involved in mRNA processing and transport